MLWNKRKINRIKSFNLGLVPFDLPKIGPPQNNKKDDLELTCNTCSPGM